jgi:hypothetical protein
MQPDIDIARKVERRLERFMEVVYFSVRNFSFRTF